MTRNCENLKGLNVFLKIRKKKQFKENNPPIIAISPRNIYAAKSPIIIVNSPKNIF